MKSITVGTAGHIDHGKSALVRALTGTDPDRLKEEKARGITIDLGFAHLPLEEVVLGFVDVPGHERFVKNMLAGVGGIDLVLLVVAADESVMPQTREHFDICRLLQVPAGIVVLTKADLVDRDTLELARLEVRDLVAGSFLAEAPAVAVSSKTGEGLGELRALLLATARGAAARPDDGPARLPIDRVFSVKGFGTVITGTLVSGRVRPGEHLRIVPPLRGQGAVTVVRGVQVHGAPASEAVAGQRTALNLAGVDVPEVARGQVLVTPGAFEATRVADAAITLLRDARPLRHGSRVRVHQGTAEAIGRVAAIGPARGDGEPVLDVGEPAFVRLRLERPVVLGRGDRFILRAYSPVRTIGGGQILDPAPPRMAVRTQSALERCRRLDTQPIGTPESTVAAARVIVEEAGLDGLPISSLVSRCGVGPLQVQAMVDLLGHSGVEAVRDRLLATRLIDEGKRSVVELLAAHHRDDSLSAGMPREEVRGRLFGRHHPAVFEHVLQALAASGAVVAGGRLRLADHQVTLLPEEHRARELLEEAVRRAGLAPPETAELARRAGIRPSLAERLLRLLQREQRIVKIESLCFHQEALRTLKERVSSLKNGGAEGCLDVASFKKQFGVTRKHAIPLLEYLDRERVTRRVGDGRLVL
jgi:selenocysteine-specific elongation factor